MGSLWSDPKEEILEEIINAQIDCRTQMILFKKYPEIVEKFNLQLTRLVDIQAQLALCHATDNELKARESLQYYFDTKVNLDKDALETMNHSTTIHQHKKLLLNSIPLQETTNVFLPVAPTSAPTTFYTSLKETSPLS